MLYQCLMVSRDDKDLLDGVDECIKIMLNRFLERYCNNIALLSGKSKQDIVSLTM